MRHIRSILAILGLLAIGVLMVMFVDRFENSPALPEEVDVVTMSSQTPVLPAGSYRLHVESVYDGDTFTIIWEDLPPELRELKIRVRGIDTPEMRGDCPSERALALRARNHTRAVIAANDNYVVVRNLAWDKYGGRIDADVQAGSVDLARDLVNRGLARVYLTGARQSWC
jgi:micrococcal nuclease